MKFVAICGAGLEKLIGEELHELGGQSVIVGIGSVSWTGSLESGYRACLWSRLASRILLPIAEFTTENEDDLYEQARLVNWTEHLDTEKTFAVDCTLAKDAPFKHSKYTSLRVKDAIADYFVARKGIRPDVRVNRPDVLIHVHADSDRTVLSIDLSGESLHRRGYRSQGGSAPLKETLAAAIIKLSGWQGEEPLIDPMCGTGTLLIEAALMFGDSAPGLGRTFYGIVGWAGHDSTLWAKLVSEAIEREEAGQQKVWPAIVGYDADPSSARSSRANIKKAGLDDRIIVTRGDLFSIAAEQESGSLVCNPPYGERLSEKETVKYLYRAIGNRLREIFPDWKINLFTSNPDFADMTGLKWHNKHRLYNGSIPCRLFVGQVENQHIQQFQWNIVEQEETDEVDDFANRLRKNLKKAIKWSRKEKIECFRVYDRDLPEFNICIDLYNKYVHIQEFAAPSTIELATAADRFNSALRVVRSVLGVGRDRVYIKTRKRQRGKKQYDKVTLKSGKMYEVREGRCFFLVNFTDYLDTGLFLDHRTTRLRIAHEAAGKRFLNLFGYTASATVHAILGGASSTTTVDLSQTYITWAEKNFALNGIYQGHHNLVRADCLEWLKSASEMFDLIFVDPPTFSNTRQTGRVFDVQKQQVELINLAMDRLNPNGLLLFSTNYKSFKFESCLNEQYNCNNISSQSVPEDFKRTPRVHQCWELRHK